MEENFEFTQVEKRLVEMANAKRIPLYGGFELTPYCNMNCKMCYVNETKKNLNILSKEQWIDLGKQAVDAGTLFLVLTGGEPLIHPEFQTIYYELNKMGIILTINTNGTLINEEMANFFEKYRPRRVNISLYGPNDEVYKKLCRNSKGFTQVKRAIKLLKERKIAIKINITVNTINFPYLDEMYEFCSKYDLPVESNSYMFEPIRKNKKEKQQYRLSAEKMAIANLKWDEYRFTRDEMIVESILIKECLEKYRNSTNNVKKTCNLPCRAGRSSFWICWDGNMTACVNIPEPKENCCIQKFQEAWKKIVDKTSKIFVSGKCYECSLKNFCQSCGAIAYHENGTFNQEPKIMCECTEKFVKSLADRMVLHKRD